MKKMFAVLTLAVAALFSLNVNADVVNVAEVDNTKYTSLSDALAAADGKTIKLLADVELSSTFTVDTAKNVTIDLNSHTLTGPATGYAIENKGTLTIQDTGATKGSVTCVATQSSCIANNDTNATMTLNGVTVVNPSVYAGVINRSSNKGLTVKDSTITVSKVGGSGVQNYGVATVEGTKITLTNKTTTGVMNYGTATIKDTSIKGPAIGSAWSIQGLTDNAASETTVENVTVTGTAYVKVQGTSSQTAVLSINGLTGAKQIQSYEGSNVRPDAENTANVMKYASSGAGIVVPSDYEGEFKANNGVKFVNAKGTEVVYVTFNGNRYDVEKGQNWTNNKALMGAIVDAQAVIGKNLVRYVDSEGKTVDKNTTFNKDTEIRAIYEVTVKITTKDGDVTLKVEEGTSLADQTGSNKEKLDAIRANKFRRFETTDGKSFGSTTKITSNLDLKVVYYVAVTVDKSVYFIDEGTSLLDNADIFKGLKEVEGKTFEKFVTTKDGKDFSEETKINEDVELTMLFKTVEEEPPVVEEEVTPPPTLDNVISYVIALVVGLMVVGTASFILIKKNREN